MLENIQATAVAVLTMTVLGFAGMEAATKAIDTLGKATSSSHAPKAQPKDGPVVTVSEDGVVTATFVRQR